MKKLLIALTAFMIGLLLVGCGGDDLQALDANIVGTWHFSLENIFEELIFNANGTGSSDLEFLQFDELESSPHSFEWTVNGEVISMDFGGGLVEEWESSINNGSLSTVNL